MSMVACDKQNRTRRHPIKVFKRREQRHLSAARSPKCRRRTRVLAPRRAVIVVEHLDWMSPRPVLFITGDHAHSRIFSEHAFKKASEPKELYVVPNAGHVDLYDRVEVIPWKKRTAFFTEHLK